jgi:hypothetical protein
MFTKSIPLIFLLASATTAFGGDIGPLPITTTTTTIKNEPSLFLGLS